MSARLEEPGAGGREDSRGSCAGLPCWLQLCQLRAVQLMLLQCLRSMPPAASISLMFRTC